MRTTINLYGVELECTFEFDPPEAATETSRPHPADARLTACIAKGDILEMLNRDLLDKIETKLIEEMEERLGA
jgi:hypothetical protein